MLLWKSLLVVFSLHLSSSVTCYSFYIFLLFFVSFFPLPLSSPVCPSFLLSVPGLSWLLVLLYLPDAQKWYQGALGTPCPPRCSGSGLSLSPAAPGYISSYSLLCLPDQGHQGGAVASLPETGGRAQLPQLKPRPPASSSNQSCHWPCLPASPNLTMLPMEVPEGVQQRDSPAKLKWFLPEEVAKRQDGWYSYSEYRIRSAAVCLIRDSVMKWRAIWTVYAGPLKWDDMSGLVLPMCLSCTSLWIRQGSCQVLACGSTFWTCLRFCCISSDSVFSVMVSFSCCLR